jgi:hypothetical protein
MITSNARSNVANMMNAKRNAVSSDFHHAIRPTIRMKPATRKKLAT